MSISPNAGKLADPSNLVDVSKLITSYYSEKPNPWVKKERVSFGTSGHRGSSFNRSFNENHILAITQSICRYRKLKGIDGPLFLGIDTHALSEPSMVTAVEVLAANDVDIRLAPSDEYTPTPAVSHAILTFNAGRTSGWADGIVITPSHNPPTDGGFKYNPPNGGPADTDVTSEIALYANQFLENGLSGVLRMTYKAALRSSNTRRYDYLESYVRDLDSVIDMNAIRDAGVRIGVDPLGGAGVHYWGPIAELYGLDLTVISDAVDPTFRFMTLDWDGKIRLDPSSPYAMERLIAIKDKFDLSVACDTDHDRHGIVTPDGGLIQPNHYLAAAISYLFQNRPHWGKDAAVGKTVVSSQIIDRVAESLGRKLYEVPVGFKWFVDGLLNGSLGFVGEESAGASLLRRNGTVWTTDKDGPVLCLLAAEMKAKTGHTPSQIYMQLTEQLGEPIYGRFEAPATPEEKAALKKLSPGQVAQTELAGDPIVSKITTVGDNKDSIEGLKVSTGNGWFAARPSGTEANYKIYAESFVDQAHLDRIMREAQAIVSAAIATSANPA